MTATKVPTNCDFSQTSIIYAAATLNVSPHDLTVYASRFCQVDARKIQGEWGFELVIVPDALMPTRFGWAVENNGRVFWSPGCA